MFTDHMFFSGTTEFIWVLFLLTSIATSYRAQCFQKRLNRIPGHSAPGFSVSSNPIFLLAPRKFGARCLSSFGSGVRAARTVRDLFPSGPCVPANGKEETSC